MNDIIPNEFSIAISIWCIKFPKNLNKTLIATIKKRSDFWSNLLIISSRDDRIWTCGPRDPNTVRYQAALHPDDILYRNYLVFKIVVIWCATNLSKQYLIVFSAECYIPTIFFHTKTLFWLRWHHLCRNFDITTKICNVKLSVFILFWLHFFNIVAWAFIFFNKQFSISFRQAIM